MSRSARGLRAPSSIVSIVSIASIAVAGVLLAVLLPARAADGELTLAALDRIGRAIVVERCARPTEVKTVQIRAETPGAPDDEMESTSCQGLRMAVYRVNATRPAHERPMSLVLEAAHPKLPAALGVGATADGVRASLGAPAAVLGDNLVYALAARDTVTFEVQAGRVRAVTWTWDVD